jgi:hypothetical protein
MTHDAATVMNSIEQGLKHHPIVNSSVINEVEPLPK